MQQQQPSDVLPQIAQSQQYAINVPPPLIQSQLTVHAKPMQQVLYQQQEHHQLLLHHVQLFKSMVTDIANQELVVLQHYQHQLYVPHVPPHIVCQQPKHAY